MLQPAEIKYANQFVTMEEEETNVTGWHIDRYDRYGDDGGGRFVIAGMFKAGMDTEMSGMNVGKEVETGPIGILSNGCTFASDNQNEGTTQQQEQEHTNTKQVTAALRQYGTVTEEEVGRLQEAYKQYREYNIVPGEIQNRPLPQQLQWLKKEQEEEKQKKRDATFQENLQWKDSIEQYKKFKMKRQGQNKLEDEQQQKRDVVMEPHK